MENCKKPSIKNTDNHDNASKEELYGSIQTREMASEVEIVAMPTHTNVTVITAGVLWLNCGVAASLLQKVMVRFSQWSPDMPNVNINFQMTGSPANTLGVGSVISGPPLILPTTNPKP